MKGGERMIKTHGTSPKEVPCMVGGWEISAVEGEEFTFGCGGNSWGPYRLHEVWDDMDVWGSAKATPIIQKKGESLEEAKKRAQKESLS
jgi:hypothetical protein